MPFYDVTKIGSRVSDRDNNRGTVKTLDMAKDGTVWVAVLFDCNTAWESVRLDTLRPIETILGDEDDSSTKDNPCRSTM